MLSGIASLGIVTASFGSWLLGKVRSSKKRVRALRDATCSKLTRRWRRCGDNRG